jgi:hypothetical protein
LAFVTFDPEAEQHLVAAVLRPGLAAATDGTLGLLGRLVPWLRRLFPGARIRVRLDGGFVSPLMFDLLESLRVEYLVAMGGRLRLEARGPATKTTIGHLSS